MTLSSVQRLSLEDFLALPQIEASPAWEYIDGQILQKPMPKTRHSILQKHLLRVVDAAGEVYTALPELRCTFGGRSVVPDVAIVAWERIPVNDLGEPEDNFMAAPDWTIEILSPDQKATRVIDNILHCLGHGCRLGWLLDPDDYSVLVFRPGREPVLLRGEQELPVLEGLALELTVDQVFGWLRVRR